MASIFCLCVVAIPACAFAGGDAKRLPFDDGPFDVVVSGGLVGLFREASLEPARVIEISPVCRAYVCRKTEGTRGGWTK